MHTLSLLPSHLCTSNELSQNPLFRSKSRPRSQVGTEAPQHKNTQNTSHTQASQQTDTSPNAQVAEEWPCEMNGTTCDRRAGKVIAGKQRRSVLRVGQVNVEEYTLEQDEDADRENDHPDLEN